MRLLFLTLASLALLGSTAGAQQIDIRRHIEVDATSQISADVDRASWQIKIRGEAASLADASKALDAATASLRDRLKQGGLDAEALRLSGIASGKHYENARETRVFKGFYAERAAVVEISDLSKRQALETVLLADDQIETVKVDLRSSKHAELRKQALLAAMAAAREKATFLAKEAGADLGPLLAIREGASQNGWGTLISNSISQPLFAQDQGAEFEKLEYTATVTVKFELR
ncbi:SIMPL domain-containing protein [Brevifollis gellanilyticus]|uniref:SIMPL domain-containing protein n=1 Tax=Brevifollis gellanilyticus TaxID=748831 RepID=A0A512MI00_9BACT|nr:SIMPL domain-containing protein [Brevifollis gellanilyticus]GEP46366.1 hypothetical protein BGE01nite_56570 [Brevifollis gellanilyticus]